MQIPAPTEDDAPAEPGEWSLERLRGELDRLDESLHALLMERADVVARLTRLRLKPGVALRPGREAEIIRRRLARHHGPLPRATIVRIWRELLVGTTSMQGPFSVAVCAAGCAVFAPPLQAASSSAPPAISGSAAQLIRRAPIVLFSSIALYLIIGVDRAARLVEKHERARRCGSGGCACARTT